MNNKCSPLKLCLLLLPGVGLIVFFIGIVIAMACIQSLGFFNFAGESKFTPFFWHKVFTSYQFWRTFFYSFKIASVSAFLSVMVAYPLAIWLRKPFYGSTLISSILKIPMLIHGLVAAFLYVNVIAYHGFLNELLVLLNITDGPIRMQNDQRGIGVIILQVWKQMPFALLLLLGAVQSIGDDILFAAQDLGANAFDRFRKVITPLTMKSLQAALIIIFIGAAGDYSFQVIAGPTQVNSMAQYMFRVRNQGGGWNEAAVVAVMLMVLSLIGSLLIVLITKLSLRKGRNI